jgi:uncharacterized membrane protein YbaN (DUF454 family)
MPTTVFLILASYFFARSSPRLDQWLLTHRWFGPPLRRFRETGGMPWRAKLAALASMWLAVLISTGLLLRASAGAAAAVALGLAVAGTLTILFWVRTVPDRSES